VCSSPWQFETFISQRFHNKDFPASCQCRIAVLRHQMLSVANGETDLMVIGNVYQCTADLYSQTALHRLFMPHYATSLYHSFHAFFILRQLRHLGLTRCGFKPCSVRSLGWDCWLLMISLRQQALKTRQTHSNHLEYKGSPNLITTHECWDKFNCRTSNLAKAGHF